MKNSNKMILSVILATSLGLSAMPGFAQSDSMPSGNSMPMQGDMKGMPMNGDMKAMGNMPMMGGMNGEMPMMKMMEERQAMMQEHMKKMETSMGNIESLLQQLVELQKKS